MEILENCDHIKGIVLSPWLVGNNVSLQWKKCFNYKVRGLATDYSVLVYVGTHI